MGQSLLLLISSIAVIFSPFILGGDHWVSATGMMPMPGMTPMPDVFDSEIWAAIDRVREKASRRTPTPPASRQHQAAASAHAAGADVLVAGSAVFGANRDAAATLEERVVAYRAAMAALRQAATA